MLECGPRWGCLIASQITANETDIQIMAKKKVFSTSIDSDRIRDLKHLAVDTDKSLGNLLEEAIKDIVKKYRDKLKK